MLFSARSASTWVGSSWYASPLAIGYFLGALSVCKRGVELDKDPVYQRRLAAGVIKASESREKVAFVPKKGAKLSVAIFVLGAVLIVLFGTIPSLRPTFMVEGKLVTLSMTHIIEIIMLVVAGVVSLLCKPNIDEVAKSSVFPRLV